MTHEESVWIVLEEDPSDGYCHVYGVYDSYELAQTVVNDAIDWAKDWGEPVKIYAISEKSLVCG